MAGERVGSENEGVEVGERGDGRWNLGVEFVVGEVEEGELGETRDGRRESAGVSGRVEGDLGDSGGLGGGAGEAADEMGDLRNRAWISGEVPRS